MQYVIIVFLKPINSVTDKDKQACGICAKYALKHNFCTKKIVQKYFKLKIKY